MRLMIVQPANKTGTFLVFFERGPVKGGAIVSACVFCGSALAADQLSQNCTSCDSSLHDRYLWLFLNGRRFLKPLQPVLLLAPPRPLAFRLRALYGDDVHIRHWTSDRLPGLQVGSLSDELGRHEDDTESYSLIVSLAPVAEMSLNPAMALERLTGRLHVGGSLIVTEQATQGRGLKPVLQSDKAMAKLLSDLVPYDTQVRGRLYWSTSTARAAGVDFAGLKDNSRPIWWLVRGQ
jgi:hypothetical protein